MCGIIGALNMKLQPSMLEMISHRGPDSSGFSEFLTGSHLVSMGHRRLAIVDLSAAGHQPMENENGTGVITYNGSL